MLRLGVCSPGDWFSFSARLVRSGYLTCELWTFFGDRPPYFVDGDGMSCWLTLSFSETPSFFHGKTSRVDVRVDPTRYPSSFSALSLAFFVAYWLDCDEAFRFFVFVGCTVIASCLRLGDIDRSGPLFFIASFRGVSRFLRGER